MLHIVQVSVDIMKKHHLFIGNNMNELKQAKQSQQGSTLLEILVSVFILGFGL